ncbi:hypothetical protein KL918_002723 [Ogataea parapolymorpha]|nr:hypothetical protein KL918_002723 [Ogataea parapolymorpha]KAG7871010.1 hypothetical protein KL916_004376 [Ogataea parapolymorpha]
MFRPGRLQTAPNVWKRALSNFESRITRHETSSDDKKDLILTILSSTATKREARNYLSKYPLLKENDIYQSHRRILDSDVVSQTSKHDKLINDLLLKHSARSEIQLPEPPQKPEIQLSDTLRVALIRIPTPRRLDPETLRGIALTLRKLVQLGVKSAGTHCQGPFRTGELLAARTAGGAVVARHNPNHIPDNGQER